MSNSIALPDDFHLPEMEVLYTTTNRDGDPHRIMGYTTEQVKAVAVRAFILGASSAKPKKAAKSKAGEPPKPTDVAEQTWSDFLALRKIKKAPLTPTALTQITNAAAKAGYTLEAALQMCCERGWQAFRADWVTPQRAAPGSLGNRNYGTSNGHF